MRFYSSESDYNYFLEQVQRYERIRKIYLESYDTYETNKHIDDLIDKEFELLRRCAVHDKFNKERKN
jgi:hypothetical protein